MKEHAATACECGCGITVKNRKRFVRGHWSRTPEARAGYTLRRKRAVTNPNPSGFCVCGCGEITPLAKVNQPDRGYYKGQHVRFIAGHQIKSGAASHKWRGGRWVHPSGYVLLYAPDHPHTNGKGYVYEHRLVVEKRIGRLLEPGERVHHLNHNRCDNCDENLILFPSHSAHMSEHKPPARTAAQNAIAGKKGAEARWRGKK